jgi:hypothetical protein
VTKQPRSASSLGCFAPADVLWSPRGTTTGSPTEGPSQVGDHRPLLEAAGFAIVAYEETDWWRDRLCRVNDHLLQAVDELAAEAGTDPDKVRDDLAEATATVDFVTRRIVFIAAPS